MSLLPEQQALELIGRAKNILVTTREHASTDGLASVIAMGLVLKKLGKTFDICAPGFKPEELPGFLPKGVQILPGVGAMRAFHISLDVGKTPLSELMYDVKDGKLDITLVPKQGEWTDQDVKTNQGRDRYDLIIALDVADMKAMGDLFRDKADFLYRTTVINIDCSAGNEYWGQVNLVDLNAVSTSEALYNLISNWNKQHMDSEVATAVLAGMISRTRSFRSANVTPKTLQISSDLVAMGARRAEIVSGLWRNQSISTLKLWGRVLSRLEQDHENGIVWVVLTETDFLESGARIEALDGVVDELIAFAPTAKIVAIGRHTPEGLALTVHAQPPLSAAELVRPLGGTGSRDRASVTLVDGGHPLEEMKKAVERLGLTLKTKSA